MLWINTENENKVILNIDILSYEEGNAFKRWLIPGWGATKLSIKADLKEDNKSIGTATAMHDIAAGGGFTIGAWKYIFDNVSKDIVADLKAAYEKQNNKKNTFAKAKIEK